MRHKASCVYFRQKYKIVCVYQVHQECVPLLFHVGVYVHFTCLYSCNGDLDEEWLDSHIASGWLCFKK